ncbi:hypothetical protein A2960_04760 [Candidatus Gottesmanbacteria bacterium RIFCSPLOWO2_01_FULL_39_12b]|uniref:Small ribosomal subunit protein bS20 n=1 Tax=Candidatus Gottesmanbacteria bacterium RIFCSPLOWO2_01_FULL_39_12b TaxID=1798388 RepID=A0A1F6APT2_9BACT|nr:MAG: hypothetical protein A2960_04760 [Candidatus Gottesmanbacteria bacterium RIFCSPLOWO2_01_FULL_39_12b]
MPVTRGAKKKLRQDKKRERQNRLIKKSVKVAIKQFRLSPNPKDLAKVMSLLDKAKNKKVYHPNKVSRLKSGLSKFHLRKESITLNKTKIKPLKKTPRKIKSGV